MKHHIRSKVLEKLKEDPNFFEVNQTLLETKPSRITRHKDKHKDRKRKQD